MSRESADGKQHPIAPPQQRLWFPGISPETNASLPQKTTRRKVTLYRRKLHMHNVVFEQDGDLLIMRFVDNKGNDNGTMTELDLSDNLRLPSGYSRAMMLSLLWVDQPKRIYHIGFGGGTIPSVLHHYFPDAVIENTEIDPEVLSLGIKYFGVKLDPNLSVVVEDGRAFLERMPASRKYDIIMLDAFRGTGYIPHHLSTREFFQLCKNHLEDGGLVVVNLIIRDPLFRRRVETISSCFNTSYLVIYDGGKVAFGTDSPALSTSELVQRADILERRLQLRFPLVPIAEELRMVDEQASFLAEFSTTGEPLEDSVLPVEVGELTTSDPIFRGVGRNDRCPCGSGKKFKHCHGR